MPETKKEVIITGDSNTLIKRDWERWFRNVAVFTIPLAIVYLTSIMGLLNQGDRVFQLKDLIPNQMTLGALTLYILNALQDLYLKWSNETRYIK